MFTGYNPHMISDPGDLRVRLKTRTDHAWRLYCALETVIPYQESQRYGQPVIHRQRLIASTIPWHANAAMLVVELDAEIRRLEAHLKEAVSGVLTGRRGGSARNTRYALKSVANLVLAPAVSDEMALGVLNKVDRWVRRADAVFNPESGLHHIPRAPGEPEVRCPHCNSRTMRWQPSTGIAVCLRPSCVTEDGVRPRWQMQFTFVDDRLQFAWGNCEVAA